MEDGFLRDLKTSKACRKVLVEIEYDNGYIDISGLDTDERKGRTIDGHLPESWKWGFLGGTSAGINMTELKELDV